MVGPIFDDFYHITNACSFFENNPGFRFLVYGLTCLSEGSFTIVRTLTLLSIIVSSILAVRIFCKELKISHKITIFLILCTHPIVLFPFFYASQISTALTIVWSFSTAYFLLFLSGEKTKFSFINWLTLFTLAFIGCGLRQESLYYLLLILLVSTFFDGVILKKSIREETKKLLKNFCYFFLITFFFSISLDYFLPYFQAFYDPLFLLHEKLILPALANPNFASNDSAVSVNDLKFYPLSSHIYVQFYACWLYLKGFFLPYNYSFFGPWSHWITIHSSIMIQAVIAFFTTAMTILLSILSYRSKNPRISIFSYGILTFYFVCLFCSLIPRMDWYFISRSCLATMLAIPICLQAFKNFKSTSLILISILMYSLICLGAQYANHFSNNQVFFQQELFLVGDSSPQINLLLADKEFLDRNDKIASQLYARAEHLADRKHSRLSRSALKYRVNALAGKYYLAGASRNELSESNLANELLNLSNEFQATSICLQESSIAINDCLKNGRKEKFCGFYRSDFFRPDLGFGRLRIEPKSLCKK